jgi:hypothetical protein
VTGSGLTPFPWPYVSTGQSLRVTSGPLRGVEGVVVDASNAKWLVLSVHLLQRSVAVKVERADVADPDVSMIAVTPRPVSVNL